MTSLFYDTEKYKPWSSTLKKRFFEQKLEHCQKTYKQIFGDFNISPNKPIFLGPINNFEDEDWPAAHEEIQINKIIEKKINDKLRNEKHKIQFNIYFAYGTMIFKHGIIKSGLFTINSM